MVPKGKREATVLSTIKEYEIWNHCQILHLRKNMRVLSYHLSEAAHQNLSEFFKWVLEAGEVRVQTISLVNWVSQIG